MNRAEQQQAILNGPFEGCRDPTGKADPTALVSGLMAEGPARELPPAAAATASLRR